MKRIHLAVALLAGLFATPALAQQSKVGDWTIEKRAKDTHCNASYGYKDKEDENREYAIVLSHSDKMIVMVVVYDGWEWDKVGEVLKANVGTNEADLLKNTKWEVMDKNTVRAAFEFDQSLLDGLSKGKRLTIDFDDDDDDSVEVQIPRAGEVLGALKFCEENRK